MKKILLISLIALAIIFNPKVSSSQAFQNGDNVLGVGIGFGSSLSYFSAGSVSPAISLQYEHGNWAVGGPGVISLGGYLGYQKSSYDYTYPYYFNSYNTYYSYSESLTYWVIGIRSAYHYNGLNTKDWDLYGGLMLSYDIASFSYSSNNQNFDNNYRGSYGSGLGISLYLGARYFVSDKFALFAEVGYGISDFNLGVALKL